MLLADLIKEKGIEEAIQSLDSKKPLCICEGCQNVFVWHSNWRFPDLPKKCPTCTDKEQERPSIVQERQELGKWEGVKITSLPGDWSEIETNVHTDYTGFSIVKKGKDFGISWSGRIDIFAKEPFAIGDIVNIRLMTVSHLVKKKQYERSTMKHGTIVIERNIDMTEDTEGEDNIVERNEGREYLVFEKPQSSEVSARLVWHTAGWKYTLKGYGRQWSSSIQGTPLVQWRITGNCRSGRYGTTGVLAIVDEEHPIFYINPDGDEIQL